MIGKHCGKPLIRTPGTTMIRAIRLPGVPHPVYEDIHPNYTVAFSRTCQVCGRVFTQRKRQPTKKS